MATTARDVMQKSILTVSPETPLLAVQRLFVEEGISGAPVVDEAGQVVGVISAADLLRAVAFRESPEFWGPDCSRGVPDFQDRRQEQCAADVMTRGTLSVHPDTPIPEVAHRIREHGVHRLLVVEDGRLAGILSTLDLVALLESADR